MSDFQAQCDCAAADAYLSKLIGPASEYTIVEQLVFPSATLAALEGSSGESPAVLWIGNAGIGATDGIFAAHDFGNWQWWTDQASGDAAGSISPDIVQTAEVNMVHSAPGTVWDLTWKGNGATLFTYSWDLGFDETEQLPFSVGGRDSVENIPNELILVRSVVVTTP